MQIRENRLRLSSTMAAFPHWASSLLLLGPSWLGGKGACTGCGVRWVSWWPHLPPIGYSQCSLQSTAWVPPISTAVHIEETRGRLIWGLHLMGKETKRREEGTSPSSRCECVWENESLGSAQLQLPTYWPFFRHSTLLRALLMALRELLYTGRKRTSHWIQH